jgi:hypothetical protein
VSPPGKYPLLASTWTSESLPRTPSAVLVERSRHELQQNDRSQCLFFAVLSVRATSSRQSEVVTSLVLCPLLESSASPLCSRWNLEPVAVPLDQPPLPEGLGGSSPTGRRTRCEAVACLLTPSRPRKISWVTSNLLGPLLSCLRTAGLASPPKGSNTSPRRLSRQLWSRFAGRTGHLWTPKSPLAGRRPVLGASLRALSSPLSSSQDPKIEGAHRGQDGELSSVTHKRLFTATALKNIGVKGRLMASHPLRNCCFSVRSHKVPKNLLRARLVASASPDLCV